MRAHKGKTTYRGLSRFSALGVGLLLSLNACDSAPPLPGDDDTLSSSDGSGDGSSSDSSDGHNGSDTDTPTCSTLESAFQEEIWGPILSTNCITCHQPGGLAWEQQARFSLVPASYPGFLSQNLQSLREMQGYQFQGRPLLLAKPSGLTNHGGGVVLAENSAEYAALRDFLVRLDNEANEPDTCQLPAALDDLTELSALDTFRKASLLLAGRLPNEAETSTLEGSPSKLRDALYGLTDEPAFTSWLMTAWNDVLLTDVYGSYTGRSVDLLREADFPKAHSAYFDDLTSEDKRAITNAVRDEPLRLIAHVVKRKRPFSEILTADYSVFNRDSARIYDTDLTFEDTASADDFRPGKMSITRDGATIAWPHAGILSSPMVLNRFSTTPTNLNRHRSWWVLKTFLATDLLTVADRPVDTDAASAYPYPWRQDNQCVVCHAVLDPIAGAWSNFDHYDAERYRPEQQPPANVFDPGFGEVSMPPNPAGGKLSWLAKQIAQDERFPMAMARLAFTQITGRKPVEHPRDPSATTYRSEERAWRDFDRTLAQVTELFVQSNLDYRELLVAWMETPYFRANGISGSVSAERETSLAEVGRHRLLTPEELDRKLAATTGLPWVRSWDKASWLTNDYKILYGGLNSDSVIDRLRSPNGVIAALQTRMANEFACTVVPFDFSSPKAERTLFPHVEMGDAASTVAGDEVPAAISRIRKNLVHLHARLLNEKLDENDPEITASLALFREVQEQGRTLVANGEDIAWLRCQAKRDPLTNADLPAERIVEVDRDYTVRAWIAVLSYLLSDARFLYE